MMLRFRYALIRWLMRGLAEPPIFIEVPYRAAVVLLPPVPERAGWTTEDVNHLNATLEEASGHPVAAVAFYGQPIVILHEVRQRLP